MTTTPIPGYTLGSAARSPVTLAEFELMKKSALFGDDDLSALRLSHEVVKDQVEAILDVWYGFVGSNPHLVATFAGSDGTPDGDYLAAVRGRFGRWIEDLCRRDFDAGWLAYQDEIARRHHTSGKNRTDSVDSPSGHVPLRHLFALVVPITVTIRDFLASGATDEVELDAMYQAWFKAVTLSATLWARPYSPDLW